MECLRFALRRCSPLPIIHSCPRNYFLSSAARSSGNGRPTFPAAGSRHAACLPDTKLPDSPSEFRKRAGSSAADAGDLRAAVETEEAAPVRPAHGERFDEKLFGERQQWISRFSGTRLPVSSQWWYGPQARNSSNSPAGPISSTAKPHLPVENAFGLSRVPVGLSGPLLIRGEHVNGYVTVPWATSEGALLASSSRGAQALSRSGGTRSFVQSDGILLCPVLVLHGIEDAKTLADWLQEHKADIVSYLSKQAGIKPISLESKVSGRNLLLRIKLEPSGDVEAEELDAVAKDMLQ